MPPALAKQQRPAYTAVFFRWAALGTILLVVYGSLLPFRYKYRSLEEALTAFRQITVFDPSNLEARGDWVISAVLFAGLGFLLLAALCVDRPPRTGLWAAPGVMAVCFALSVVVEFLQLYFPPRTVSLNDVLVESLGGIAGSLVWLVSGQQMISWLRRLGRVTTASGLAAKVLPAYVAVLLAVQLMPFDFVIGYDELAVKYAEGKVRLLPWTGSEFAILDALAKAALNASCFIPLGFLLALSQRREESSGRLLSISWVALAAPAFVELLQFFVYSRSCNAADVITGMLGVYIGWLLGRSVNVLHRTSSLLDLRPKSVLGAFAAPLFLAWLGAVVYFFWRPFDFTTDASQFTSDRQSFHSYGFRHLALAPFADYYWGSKYNALDQFVRKALSFVPLGALAALSLRDLYKRGAASAVLLVAFTIAVVLEGGRYFLPSRFPSSTDVLIACAGAWIGFWLTQRFRVVLWTDAALYGWMGQSGPTHLAHLDPISSS